MISQDSDPPIACRLNALSSGERIRQKELLEKVRDRALQVVEIALGFEVRFPSDRLTFVELAEWVGLERLCCPFAEFAILWRRDETVWVRVTGGEGAKEVLAAEMGFKLGGQLAK